MIIRNHVTSTPKGLQATSLGHRPRYIGLVSSPCKGKSICIMLTLLPLQGVSYILNYPWRCHGLVARCPFGAQSPNCG